MPCDDCLRISEAVREIVSASQQRLSWPEFLRQVLWLAMQVPACEQVQRADVVISEDPEDAVLHVDIRVTPIEGVSGWDAQAAALERFDARVQELARLEPLDAEFFITS